MQTKIKQADETIGEFTKHQLSVRFFSSDRDCEIAYGCQCISSLVRTRQLCMPKFVLILPIAIRIYKWSTRECKIPKAIGIYFTNTYKEGQQIKKEKHLFTPLDMFSTNLPQNIFS